MPKRVGGFGMLPPRGNSGITPERVNKYGLDEMAVLAQSRPGVPLLAGVDIPEAYSRSLRARRRDPYLTDDGRIIINTRNKHWNKDVGDVCTDVYFTWEKFSRR